MKRKDEIKLDKRDMKILYFLDIDGRISYSELAKKIGISKQLTRYRVERLENEGYIKGYFPMIDLSALGFTTFRVYLKLRNVTPEKKKEIIDYLKKQKKTWAVIIIAGKWDAAVGIAVENIYEFYDVWEEILRKYLLYIRDYSHHIYSPVYHYARSFLIDKKDETKVRILGNNKRAKYDEKDVKILSALSKNARIHIIEIAKKSQMSPELASYRIKQLEKKKILQGYRAMIDFVKLGYEFYKAEIRLSSYDKISSIMQYCHQHPNIYQLNKNIGGETLEIEFIVKSVHQMLEIMDDFRTHFPGMVESFDYIQVISEEKTTYMPEL